ncbi:MAG: bifunctional demethylmenaquinone methyltransferase/2-methoxy-6-polyprenyl-1,4-benzoquinol methylase UbiE [Alloprevotella sp.]|nr:bifunctional demethylmenaquinone methyltransferase/2-methoxy-6-polyprenyl-1,4-benzoquinol methylase UbiE [Alloprevotella sp.]
MSEKYAQETIKPYEETGSKTAQVEQMFDNIAHSYDLLNHFLSCGIDRNWRKKAILSLENLQPKEILDVATGTGDFAILSAQLLNPAKIVGIDLSQKMLEIGREKVAAEKLDGVISLLQKDCGQLSFADESFDAVTVAYGARNFADLELGLREIRRVLKSNGRLVMLELTAPKHFPMRQLFWIYSHIYMPMVGRLISKDAKAYKYLPATMEAFPQGEVMSETLKGLGYRDVNFRRFTFGLCTLYTAGK